MHEYISFLSYLEIAFTKALNFRLQNTYKNIYIIHNFDMCSRNNCYHLIDLILIF